MESNKWMVVALVMVVALMELGDAFPIGRDLWKPEDWKMEDQPGEWKMEDQPGEWKMEDQPGEWKMEDQPGEWKMEDQPGGGQWKPSSIRMAQATIPFILTYFLFTLQIWGACS